MTTLTIQIANEGDLSALQEVLNRMGLEYQVQEDEWAGLSGSEIAGINTGLDDIEAGRTFTYDEVKNRIAQKLKQFGIDQ